MLIFYSLPSPYKYLSMSWKKTEEHEHTQNRQFQDLENLYNNPLAVSTPQSTAEMADKDFQLVKEAWKALQKAKEELTTAEERADTLAGKVVNLPEVPVSSANDVHGIKYLKERHDFQGDAKISRELPEKAKVAIRAKAAELKVIVKD